MGVLDVPGYSRAQIDARLAGVRTRADAVLPGTLMVLGDSLMAEGWDNGPHRVVRNGRPTAMWAVLHSRGRLVLGGDAATGPAAARHGYSTRRIIDELLPLVETARPGLCAVICGANNVATNIGFEETITHFREIFTRLARAGVTPIVCTTPPRLGPPALVEPLNQWLHGYARYQGLPFADTFAAVVDPATRGQYRTDLHDGGGGHPNTAGASLMGRAIADAVAPFVPAGLVPLPTYNRSAGSADRLIAATDNALMLTESGGLPSGWGAPAGISALSDGPTLGRALTLTRGPGNDGCFVDLTEVDAGDRLLLAAELASSGTGTFAFDLRNPDGVVAGISSCDAAIPAGSVFAQEVVWPGGTATLGAVVRDAAGAALTFSRAAVVNLSAAGFV